MKKLATFRGIYRLYRRAHSRRYSFGIAFGCAFRGLPF
jgi:hypothetical protein